jgi:peroxiredoxin
VAGKIGVTVLALYLLGVAVRIEGCYAPELSVRDARPQTGPAVGAVFPPFRLPDLSGATIALADLAGAPAVLLFAPRLDWSPPTKARLLDLAAAVRGRTDVRVAVITIAAQDGPRARSFVRDRSTPFYYLVDDAGLTERLGLLVAGPDDTPAAATATFVLDARGTVRLRDIRAGAERWLDPRVVLDAVADVG